MNVPQETASKDIKDLSHINIFTIILSLEKINRKEELVCETEAAVAKLGQTRRTQDRLGSYELSSPVGVRGFESHPPHHNSMSESFFAIF